MTDLRFAGKPDAVLAQQYAELAHAGQRYNDEVPYTVHLAAVCDVLKRFAYGTPEMLSAAWLHDAIEDTNTSYGDVLKRFGTVVAELVYAVTSELGRNRTERNVKTYPKLRGAGEAAITLKLADRIANVEYGAATGGKNDMYSKEFASFEGQLRYTVEVDGAGYECDPFPTYPALEPMWNHLAKLLR